MANAPAVGGPGAFGSQTAALIYSRPMPPLLPRRATLGFAPLVVLLPALCAFAAENAAVDAYVRGQMDRLQVPGLSLAVVKDGQVVYSRGYGLANVELKVPVGPDTVFQIQSITKTFTAAAVMMLVEEGKVGLDDPVGKYLDGTPDSWMPVTIRQLLSHTSGIKDFINEPTASLRLDVSEQEVLEATAPRPLNFKPGDKYLYSNTGYHLLAMVIRKVTGKSYGTFSPSASSSRWGWTTPACRTWRR